MGLALPEVLPSWQSDNSPMVLSDIFSPAHSVVIWKRSANPIISTYFKHAYSSLGMGIRQVLPMTSLRQSIAEMLPEHEGKSEVVEDIFLLSDMLTCLFHCESVGLRLVPLTKAMCPKFHRDNIPVRLVNTYLGPATEWLPHEVVGSPDSAVTKKRAYSFEPDDVQQMRAFDVGLLKGSAWEGQEHMAAVHRSCQVPDGEKRVLLTLDPM